MLLGKTEQSLYFDPFAVIGDHKTVVVPEHLVHLAGDDRQAGGGGAVLEGGEGQVEAVFTIREVPGLHVIAGDVIELDLLQFVDATLQDEGVLPGFGEIPEAHPQVEAEAAPVRQEAGG